MRTFVSGDLADAIPGACERATLDFLCNTFSACTGCGIVKDGHVGRDDAVRCIVVDPEDFAAAGRDADIRRKVGEGLRGLEGRARDRGGED